MTAPAPQTTEKAIPLPEAPKSLTLGQQMVRHNVLNHLSVGAEIGTLGLGLDLSMPVTDWARIRTGFSWFPKFSVPLDFSLMSYNSEGGVNSGNFTQMQDIMRGLTGIEVDENIDMEGKPNLFNFKFLVDIYPWQADRRWRLTAGFYVGSSKVAKATNTIYEMPSLLAVNIYNRFYDYLVNEKYFDEPLYGDYYLNPDEAEMLREKMMAHGEMGIHVGDFKDGTPYMMKPDTDGLVKAWAIVNSFRPYFGFGFGSALDKKKRLYLDVDLGVLLWGGRPKIVTHENVDLARDVVNISGKPGDYVDLVKKFTVYPVLTFRLSYNLF